MSIYYYCIIASRTMASASRTFLTAPAFQARLDELVLSPPGTSKSISIRYAHGAKLGIQFETTLMYDFKRAPLGGFSLTVDVAPGSDAFTAFQAHDSAVCSALVSNASKLIPTPRGKLAATFDTDDYRPGLRVLDKGVVIPPQVRATVYTNKETGALEARAYAANEAGDFKSLGRSESGWATALKKGATVRVQLFSDSVTATANTALLGASWAVAAVWVMSAPDPSVEDEDASVLPPEL